MRHAAAGPIQYRCGRIKFDRKIFKREFYTNFFQIWISNVRKKVIDFFFHYNGIRLIIMNPFLWCVCLSLAFFPTKSQYLQEYNGLPLLIVSVERPSIFPFFVNVGGALCSSFLIGSTSAEIINSIGESSDSWSAEGAGVSKSLHYSSTNSKIG